MLSRENNNSKDHQGQLFKFVRDSYLDRTSRPIYALMYLLGFLVFYEIGSILINPEILNKSLAEAQIRVVSFVWVQSILEYIGFSARMTWIATPLAVVIILLALQMTSHTKWSVQFTDFIPMTFECVLLAVPLIVLTLVVNRSVIDQSSVACYQPQQAAVYMQASTDGASPSSLSDPESANPEMDRRPPKLLVGLVTGIGAGIYEELVFRLILICLLMLVFQDFLQVSRKSSIILSVLIAAILFSAHHHIYFVYGQFHTGEPFEFSKFLFRTFAGIYFAVLFAIRGFGIAAGTHTFYNIIAVLLNYIMSS